MITMIAISRLLVLLIFAFVFQHPSAGPYVILEGRRRVCSQSTHSPPPPPVSFFKGTSKSKKLSSKSSYAPCSPSLFASLPASVSFWLPLRPISLRLLCGTVLALAFLLASPPPLCGCALFTEPGLPFLLPVFAGIPRPVGVLVPLYLIWGVKWGEKGEERK